ncbi:MAG: biotin-dependent carboxyltransferase family protein [Xanthomonadales bacterium]|nr:biotin-dependent carboxyltransferase family protein [Xanthomonadales bacterium]
MSLEVLVGGPQCTVQGAPRIGLRHQGVPLGGAADPLSMALANRLVGQPAWATALEVALGPARLRFGAAVWFAVTGAQAALHLAGAPVSWHRVLHADAGDELSIGPCRAGARVYLAVAARFDAEVFLGSTSTHLPAGVGGHKGRALRTGDVLGWTDAREADPRLETPQSLRPPLSRRWTLRAVAGPDWPVAAGWPATVGLRAGGRMDRMGVALSGEVLPGFDASSSHGSEAVFPGAVQCTPDGQGFLLLADGQTTGGYPHVLQVIRADRHLAGQIRPGDAVRLAGIDQRAAEAALAYKQSLLADWLPGFRLP